MPLFQIREVTCWPRLPLLFLFACIFLDGFDKCIAIFLDLEFADTADETECLEGGWLHPR